MANMKKIIPLALWRFLILYSGNVISEERNLPAKPKNLVTRVEQYPSTLTWIVGDKKIAVSAEHLDIKRRIDTVLGYEISANYELAIKKLESILVDYPRYEGSERIKNRIIELEKLK